jgi:hypothetical protein
MISFDLALLQPAAPKWSQAGAIRQSPVADLSAEDLWRITPLRDYLTLFPGRNTICMRVVKNTPVYRSPILEIIKSQDGHLPYLCTPLILLGHS